MIWFQYSGALFVVLVIINGMLYGMYTRHGGLISVLTNSESMHEGRGGSLFMIFVIFGPLINFYLWLKWNTFFVEAESYVNKTAKLRKSDGYRKSGILLFSSITLACLLPFLAWYYTNSIELLWDNYWFSWSILFVIGLFAPSIFTRTFPTWSRRLQKLEEKLDDSIDR